MNYEVKAPSWWKDKWNWLLSFNKRPSVTIKADSIFQKGAELILESHGRVDLTVEFDEVHLNSADKEAIVIGSKLKKKACETAKKLKEGRY